MNLFPPNSPFTPYILVLKRTWFTVVLFGVAAAALAFAMSSAVKPTYESHFSYLVALSERENVGEYRFDGLYAIQATDLFATTLARWTSTPEVIVAAHKAGKVTLQTQEPRALSRIIRAEKTAPQLVEVTVRSEKPEEATALVAGLQAVMDSNIDAYHDEGIPAVAFRVVATPTWQGKTEIARTAITVATFVFTVFFGINIVLLVEVFRQQKE